ncbi:SIP domain-containing protein [Streptomyces sp. ISL-24]|uniref:SIP domain-containing protein n=1 Tax=unclassified Streptomyces TaxID=2593676 RepID=UPI0035ABC27D
MRGDGDGRGPAPAAPLRPARLADQGGTSLPDGVRRLAPEPGGVAYVAGEARTAQAVRQLLVREFGWDRRPVLTKPFWTPGKRGLE